jgi:L-cysteine S-thiosulfotransferase
VRANVAAAMSPAKALGALLLLFAAVPCFSAEIAPADRRSGYADMSRETRAMEDDDTANPGMLSVLDGEALWNQKAGAAGHSCADCHGDAAQSMKGVAARYPAFDAARGRPVDLEAQINICRGDRQQAAPLLFESPELLALSAFVARQSRGMPIAPATDARLAPFTAAGRDFFNRRQGQLDLSCAQCHDDNWGKRLAGNIVPQGHPTGYPLYRLEWQSLGSLQRRLRTCISGMRAEVPEYGSPEYVNLELFLMQRARGMPMETPAVRP